ncbi:MAG: family hydrolase [Myxococcaceae bacterium]|nr:family hydrolase [Myxococcaceae bacterium]
MEYIRGPKEPGCIFCRYPAEDPARLRERLVLCARADAFVMLNKYPFASGHLMVVPTRHASDLAELSADEHAALFELVRASASALKVAVNAEGVNIGVNIGAAAGAGIAEHLHVHIVPRWRGDMNFMPVVADLRVMPEALDATWARLAPYFRPLGDAPPEAPRAASRRPPRKAR